MRITRLTHKNLAAPEGERSYDFPARGAVIVGENGCGKTATLRLLGLLLGQGHESLQSLAANDQDVPEATLYLADAGGHYRLHRQGSKIQTQLEDGGAWRDLPGTPLEALRKLFAPSSDPGDLLKPMPDSKVIELLLGVVPDVPFDRTKLLSELGVPDSAHSSLCKTLGPIPKGGSVLEFLQRVEDQLAGLRTGVGRARDAAAAVVEREARSLPAEPVPPGDAQLARARAEAEGLRADLAGLKQRVKEDKQAIYTDANVAFERAVAEAERARQAMRDAANEAADIALAGLPDMERAIGAADQAAKDAQAAHDRHVGDLARREGLAAAKLDEQAQAERYQGLDGLIRKVRQRAADFIGAALPGVRIAADEKGKRFPEVLCVKMEGGDFWVPWSDVNKAKLMEIAAVWSKLRQAQGAGGVSEAVVLLDEAEAFTEATLGRVLGSGGQVIVTRPAPGPLRVEDL